MTRLRAVMLVLALSFPMLSLVPLGSIWLWQNGFVLYWCAAALGVTGLIYGLEAWALHPASVQAEDLSNLAGPADGSAPEAAARAALEQLINSLQPAGINSQEDVTAIAVRAIETVARVFHPDVQAPVWSFTVPEALLLIERVSARTRPRFIELVPLGDQMTVGQALRLYEWRSVIGVAEKVYDIWRLMRIVNPIAAVTQEARGRVTRRLLTSLQADLTKRMVDVFVNEVGDAAIELYSGRLRTPAPIESASDEPVSHEVDSGTDPVGRSQTEPQRRKTARVSTIWSETRKVARAAAHLYWRKPRS